MRSQQSSQKMLRSLTSVLLEITDFGNAFCMCSIRFNKTQFSLILKEHQKSTIKTTNNRWTSSLQDRVAQKCSHSTNTPIFSWKQPQRNRHILRLTGCTSRCWELSPEFSLPIHTRWAFSPNPPSPLRTYARYLYRNANRKLYFSTGRSKLMVYGSKPLAVRSCGRHSPLARHVEVHELPGVVLHLARSALWEARRGSGPAPRGPGGGPHAALPTLPEPSLGPPPALPVPQGPVRDPGTPPLGPPSPPGAARAPPPPPYLARGAAERKGRPRGSGKVSEGREGFRGVLWRQRCLGSDVTAHRGGVTSLKHLTVVPPPNCEGPGRALSPRCPLPPTHTP